MSDNVIKERKFRPVPISDINMELVAIYTDRYLKGDQFLLPNQVELAKAALALQKAYTSRSYQTHLPTPEEQQSPAYLEALRRAINNFNDGQPLKGVMWGVRRSRIPLSIKLDDYVTIDYTSQIANSMVAGKVVFTQDYADGKGFVIQLMESDNGLRIGIDAWLYVSIWIPKDLNQTAGLLV